VSLVLTQCVFCVRRVYRGSIFFSLVLILHIPTYLGMKGYRFFSDLFFLALILCTNWSTTIRITCPILRKFVQFVCKIECIKFVCNKFVLVLVQIDLIQFEFLNCIRSICTKTNTNLLHTNSIHSISRKIGHVIQIVVHQFVRKMSAEKILSVKKWSPFIPRYMGICRISTKEKKMIPYKPYVCGKHVESIPGTRKNMTKTIIQLEKCNPTQCMFSRPLMVCPYPI
jgi:hypothetical protein